MGNMASIFISRGGKFVTIWRSKTSSRTYNEPTKASLKRLKAYCRNRRQNYLRTMGLIV